MGAFTNEYGYNKQYTILERDALTPTDPCTIFVIDTLSIHYYDGSSWFDLKVSTAWQPPQGNLGLGATSGVSVFRALGGGLQYSFDGTSDDEISENIMLQNNGIAYDGSTIKITVFYQLSINAAAIDDANILLELQFINIGDNTDQSPTTTDERINLDNKLNGQVYSYEFISNFTGAAGKEILMLSSLINGSGAGQGSYGGSIWQLGYKIEKV